MFEQAFFVLTCEYVFYAIYTYVLRGSSGFNYLCREEKTRIPKECRQLHNLTALAPDKYAKNGFGPVCAQIADKSCIEAVYFKEIL